MHLRETFHLTIAYERALVIPDGKSQPGQRTVPIGTGKGTAKILATWAERKDKSDEIARAKGETNRRRVRIPAAGRNDAVACVGAKSARCVVAGIGVPTRPSVMRGHKIPVLPRRYHRDRARENPFRSFIPIARRSGPNGNRYHFSASVASASLSRCETWYQIAVSVAIGFCLQVRRRDSVGRS